MKKILLAPLVLLCCFMAAAQDAAPEMADRMRGNGKIYVVVSVILLIFAGIIAYLVHLDRKISRLEKQS